MSIEKIVFDSYAVMVYLQQESGYKKVVDLLKDSEKGKKEILLCSINWGEIYYCLIKAKGKMMGEEYLVLIEQLPIKVIDADRNLVFLAAVLKSKFSLAYADCFAAALAQRENCGVLTGDKEFKSFEGEVQVRWL